MKIIVTAIYADMFCTQNIQ